jgi:hypothetical protein
MPDHALGRRYAPDVRDRRYSMSLVLEPLRETFFPRGLAEGTRHYKPGKILNQGDTGTCVAHGWTSKMHAAPIMQSLPLTPYDLYRQFVQADEWNDNDFETTAPDDMLQSGTSVRAGAKVLQTMGYLQNYLWAEDVEDVRAWHLAGFGGTVMGVNWSTDMLDTDTDGFVNYTGTVEGGHCVTTTGWSDTVKKAGRRVHAVRAQQSWPLPWGHKGTGRFWISEDDLGKLLADQGEACAPTEIRVQL